jgi:hypothetical protein
VAGREDCEAEEDGGKLVDAAAVGSCCFVAAELVDVPLVGFDCFLCKWKDEELKGLFKVRLSKGKK